jgi:hypothetical protein
MNSTFFAERKPLLISLAVLGVALCMVAAVLAFWQSLPQEETLEPPGAVAYCGAELDQLCVLSFGRDAQGDALINLFVPEEEYPDFYLKVGRSTGEVWFDCVKLEEMPSSVYCLGPGLVLGERLQVELVSQEDNRRVLAAGTFTVRAILVASDIAQFQAGESVGMEEFSEDEFSEEPNPSIPPDTSSQPAFPTPQPPSGSPPSYP